jgi:hypothetical protein
VAARRPIYLSELLENNLLLGVRDPDPRIAHCDLQLHAILVPRLYFDSYHHFSGRGKFNGITD